MTLNDILKRIQSGKIQKPWSKRSKKPSTFYSHSKDIHELLAFLAGGEDHIIEMLSDVLKKEERNEMNPVYKDALKNVASLIQNNHQIWNKFKRYQVFECLRKAKLTKIQSEQVGFKCSDELWSTCVNGVERNTPGRKQIPVDMKESVKNFMENNSNAASNRCIKRKLTDNNGNFLRNDDEILIKENISVRYRNTTIFESYSKYPFKKDLSFSSFYKIMKKDNIFKNPHRLSDLCNYCEHGRRLKKELIRDCSKYNFDYSKHADEEEKNGEDNDDEDEDNDNENNDEKERDSKEKEENGDKDDEKESYDEENVDEEENKIEEIVAKAEEMKDSDVNLNYDGKFNRKLGQMKTFFSNLIETNKENKDYCEIVQRIADYKEILDHREIAKSQRLAYNTNKSDKNLLKNSILIELDFKQKIIIGMSHRQVNSEYFNQVSRAYLGFGIYFYDELDDKIKCMNVDFIADTTTMSSNAISAIRCFRMLKNQEFFKKIDQKNYIIWTDCGTHFRCSEFAHFCFVELANLEILVNLNFFAEKHGKNSRDQHFSTISKFIEEETKNPNSKNLKSTDDIIECLKKKHKISNENRKRLKQDPILFEIIKIHNEKNENLSHYKLKLEDISKFYNIKMTKDEDDKLTLISTLTSDKKRNYQVEKKYIDEKSIQIVAHTEKKVSDKSPSVKYLKKRRLFKKRPSKI